MSAFQRLMNRINDKGYYHPRDQKASDWLSEELTADIFRLSKKIRDLFAKNEICVGLNINLEIEGKNHNIDYVIGKTIEGMTYSFLELEYHGNIFKIPVGRPDLENLYVILDHKSVVTAHRNRQNRSRDLAEFATDLFKKYPKTIIGCTIMIGTAFQYLSYETINRQLKVLDNFCSSPNPEFNLSKIKELLCMGDKYVLDIINDNRKYQKLVNAKLLTHNTQNDAENTWNEMVSKLILRENEEIEGFDTIIIQFVEIDNINPSKTVDNLNQWENLHIKKFFSYKYENSLNSLVTLFENRY